MSQGAAAAQAAPAPGNTAATASSPAQPAEGSPAPATSSAAGTSAPSTTPPADGTATPPADGAATPAEAAPVEVAPPPAVQTRIDDLSLTRVEMGGAWAVKDGRGREVDAKSWAILTGDKEVLAKLEASRRRGRTIGWALVGGGVAVAAGSLIPALTLEDALGANESTPGFDEMGQRNDIKVASAFGLVGAGAILAATGLATNFAMDHRSEQLSRHLDPAAADAAISAYNAHLGDVLFVETPAHAEAAPVEAEGMPEALEEEPAAAPEPEEEEDFRTPTIESETGAPAVGKGTTTKKGAKGKKKQEAAPVEEDFPDVAPEEKDAAPSEEAAPAESPAPAEGTQEAPPEEAPPADSPAPQ